ncbi:helix-turn-helix transcriptional regulator [Nocardia sp. NPDC005825]|uniref:helix-turn-helix transcriptional regulator n=1 Tax=unclassified Nocardia TaxID=2637762 RepID=UPI0033D4FE89
MAYEPAGLEPFSGLVASIYGSAVEPSTWPVTLREMIGVFGAYAAVVVQAPGPDREIVQGVGLDLGAAARWNDYYRTLDPVAELVERSPAGTVGRVVDAITTTERSKSEFFVDWARPTGVRDAVFARFSEHCDGPTWLCLPSESTRRYNEPWPTELMRQLVPHLRAAAGIERMVSEQARQLRLTTDILEQLDRGGLLIDQDGFVQHMNSAAHAILTRRDGLSVDGVGELSAAAPGTRTALRALIARACGRDDAVPAAGSLRVPGSGPGQYYVLHAVPIRLGDCAFRCPRLALITIVDPEDALRRSPVESWRMLYSFTPREAAIAEGVLRGEGLQAVADTLAVTLPTVRVHLQHIFQKTGTHRQAELTRLLLATGPVFTSPRAVGRGR